MDLEITGIKSKREQVIIEDAMTFYLCKLLPHRITKSLIIDLAFSKKLDDDADGYCMVTGYNTKKRAREFEIDVQNNPSMRYKLMTLAHECVHLKQYALGEIDEKMNTWKGVRISNSVDYWDSPWEIEAHGRERGLYIRFCEAYGLKFPITQKERDA
jgi:hypothetical protein